VFELVRAQCNRIQALPNEIMLMTANLPFGYHRDLQLLKEHIIPAFENVNDCLHMTGLMLEKIVIKKDLLNDTRYTFLFSVEAVNNLVTGGMPFRDAYKKVGADIEAGNFTHTASLHHTHEGAMNNLCNEKIENMMNDIIQKFNFNKAKIALQQLLS